MLNKEQLEFFDQKGYLIVENVIDTATLNDVWNEYDERLNEVAELLVDSGKLSRTYA